MKQLLVIIIVAVVSFEAGCKEKAPETGGKHLTGAAEDLWGNKVDLTDYNPGLTLIEPFSPSNCGYCMLVGEFVNRNYFRVNEERGGHNFQQCLFNPQSDIYAYQKYYRDTGVVLTYPISLHQYHEDGFPSLLAFHNGQQILNGYLDDYGTTFKQRAAEWWPGQPVPTPQLPSGMKMSENWKYESKDCQATLVVPDRDTARFAVLVRNLGGRPGISIKYERDFSEADLEKNLEFAGETNAFHFACLKGQKLPIEIDEKTLRIGGYTFPRASTGLRAVVSNPHNRERYLTFNLTAAGRMSGVWAGSSDFCFWRYDSTAHQPEVLLDGRFAKDTSNTWWFADSLSVAYANLKEFCAGGVCPIPAYLLRPPVHHSYTVADSKWSQSTDSRTMTLGNDHCRFPSLAVSSDGSTAVAWEENGDILMALLGPSGSVDVRQVEDGSADAYNPVVAWDGSSFLVIYLSNADGYYHLYGRYLDNGQFSEVIRFTGPASFDVVSPAVAGTKGTAVVAWSEWKANFRYPRYRMIVNRVLGPASEIAVVPDGAGMDYINAWGIALAFSPSGRPYGMWNQHYPATICACGGPLDGPVTTPQKLTGNVETSEIGEYPATALDHNGAQWATWCTFGFRASEGEPQRVLVARMDSAIGAWSAPYTISDTLTFLIQTPKLAVGPDGTLWVAYSGRPRDEAGTWGVYLTSNTGGKWQTPIRISDEGISGRAPVLALDAQGKPWVSWHTGVGDAMKIRVWTAQ